MLGAFAIAALLKEGSRYRINLMPSAFGCEYKDWAYTYDEKLKNSDGTITDHPIDCRYDIDQGEDQDAIPNDLREWKIFQSVLSETFGTFFFVLFFMITTDEKLRYSSDNVKNALVIASSYIAS